MPPSRRLPSIPRLRISTSSWASPCASSEDPPRASRRWICFASWKSKTPERNAASPTAILSIPLLRCVTMSRPLIRPAGSQRSRREFLCRIGRYSAIIPAGFLASQLLPREISARDTPLWTRSSTGTASLSSSLGFSLVDVAFEAGLGEALNVYGGVHINKYLLEEMGCGAAFFDYDNDGWLDIFLANGSRFDGLPPGSPPSNFLFHNNRDGTFTDVTRKAGLIRSGWGQGCCVGDYDNDGFDDLFVTYWGQNALYRNNGDGTFTDVTEKAGLLNPQPRFGSGCAFFDYDRDGRLDLFVSNYVIFDPNSVPRAGASASCDY